MRLPAKEDSVSVHLDAIRGMAALAVAISHLRGFFFADLKDVVHNTWAVKLLYLVSGLGHQAVMIFFVLSGFFISSSVLQARRKGRWSWRDYGLARMSRLYVVLIPALLLGLALDFFGSHSLPGARVFSEPGYAHMMQDRIADTLTLKAFAGNLFFLQGIHVPSFGTNGPLWSLANEFWYYVMFPLFVIAMAKSSKPGTRLATAALGIALLAFVGTTIALYFAIWLMGTAVALLPPMKKPAPNALIATVGLITLVTICATKLMNFPAKTGDFAIAIAFTIFLYLLLNGAAKGAASRYESGATWLSGISYTLYLVHVPIVVLLTAVFIGEGERLQPTPLNSLILLAVLAGVVVYAWAIWFCFEKRTALVRRWLDRVLPGGKPMAAK